MKILVCVKEVAEPESTFLIDDGRKEIHIDKNAPYRMNRYDECALEEALIIRDTNPNVFVEAISVGPEHVKRTLKRTIAMGADTAVLLKTEGYDTMHQRMAALSIAKYAESNDYDLIFTGIIAEDTMSGTTGPMIAAMLHIPCATAVIRQELDKNNRIVSVEREIDVATRECVKLKVPAVLCMQSGINRPRYPSLSNKLRANEQKIESIDYTAHIFEEHEKVMELQSAVKEKKTLFIEGTAAEKAKKLYDIFREKKLL